MLKHFRGSAKRMTLAFLQIFLASSNKARVGGSGIWLLFGYQLAPILLCLLFMCCDFCGQGVLYLACSPECFSLSLPGDLALKDGGDFWLFLVSSPFPRKHWECKN